MLSSTLFALVQAGAAWLAGPPLPVPVANNAVAGVMSPGGPAVLSFLGIDRTRAWSGVGAHTYLWMPPDREWFELPAVPGPGRLAGTAQSVAGRVWVFGGYTVAEDGSERSVPNVDVLDLEARRWSRGADIPVPTDDAVSGVWRDSLVYLVSGWHDTDNIADVQMYDPAQDRWTPATPIPGPPVFGHAGGVAGNTIVYIDGVRTQPDDPRFVMSGSSWRGDIDPEDPTRVEWSRIPDHPGPPLYRAAAGGVGSWIVFAGGTDNPYNYSGIGYDGVPSAPRSQVFAYNVERGVWRELDWLPRPTMDHRGIVFIDGRAVIVGGMGSDQEVLSAVTHTEIEGLLGSEP